MAESSGAQRRGAWERLWARGATASFASGSQTTLPLQDHWLAYFAKLPPDARVLDLGTGNGVLPRWLLASHPDGHVQCDAVDAAAIAPTWPQSLAPTVRARVRFHSETPAERLPWPSAEFDTIVSQFGAEYGDLPLIWAEIGRVARPAARLHLVMHHPESLPCTLAAEEIDHVDWLLHGGWLETARAMTEPLGCLATEAGRRELAQTTRWNGVRSAFDAQQAAAEARLAQSNCPDLLSEALQTVAERVFQAAAKSGRAAGMLALDAMTQWLADTRTRLTDMRASAQQASQMQAHAHILRNHGWHPAVNVIRERGAVMGWVLDAQRGA